MNRSADPSINPTLSIIIVSWNVKELLRACLHSIYPTRSSLDLEVIVVDSGSVDGSPLMVEEEFPWATLMAKKENVGFPKGNNIGIAESSGRQILLLNPDTEIVAGGLEKMSQYLDANRDVGAAAGQLLNPDGSVQSSRRRFPSVATGIFESTWLQPFAPRKVLESYYYEDVPPDKIQDVDWVVGACIMVRREIVDQVGLLDEDYFMYSEELDWCRRIKDDGWRVVYVPTARIIHHIGKSSDQAVVQRHINFQRAKLRYYKKFHGSGAALLIRLVLMFNYAWQMAVEAVKGAFGHKRSLRWQRVRVYWTVLRSGIKPAGE